MKDRKKAVDAFQNGEGDVFLISLKAGGTGLNLTAADYVLHMDPWWNPAVEDQAADRAHRMGQLRPVTIYRFITRSTIEDTWPSTRQNATSPTASSKALIQPVVCRQKNYWHSFGRRKSPLRSDEQRSDI